MTLFLYALVCAIWGSTWLGIKIGLVGVPPFLGAGLRFALASAVLWGLVYWSQVPARLTRDGRKAVAMSGVLNFGISYSLVYWAETRVSSGLVASLYALMPLTTALLTAFVTRTERLTLAKAAGVLIGGVGVVIVFWPAGGTAAADAGGLAAALAGSLISAANLVAQSVWSRRDDARALNAWSMSVGAVIILALSAAVERGASVTWTWTNAAALAYLAVPGSVVAFLAYFWLIRRLPATQVSFITLIFPVVALVLGALVGGETVGPRAAAGVALILGGVGLALAAGRRAAPPAAAAENG